MIDSRQLEKGRNRASVVLIAVFLISLWIPNLELVFHWDRTTQVDEKRALVPFPVMGAGLSGLRHFISGLETYYNDHFGFRKRLIYWEQTWKREWFRESSFFSVIIGKEGWLYHAGDQQTEDFLGTTSFNPRQLEQWKTLLERRRDWLSRRGIHYLFVVAPNKQTIYPEFLPDWMPTSGASAKLDQFIAYMKSHSTVDVLDLRPMLLEAKKTDRTYFYTDTHWSQYGAFIASEEIIKTLSREMPGLTALPVEAYEKQIIRQPGGNLAALLAQTEVMPENNYVGLNRRPPYPVLSFNRELKSWGVLQTAEYQGATGKAVIFGDSFAEGWLKFLCYHFNKLMHCRVYDATAGILEHKWVPAFIEQEKPDLVIDQMLERFLYLEDPEKMISDDALR